MEDKKDKRERGGGRVNAAEHTGKYDMSNID